VNDSLLHVIVADGRKYFAAAIGFGGVALNARRQDEPWRILGRQISAQQVAFVLPFFILIFAFFLDGLQFDWSGEFASGILYAFGFTFSLNLFKFRGWLFRSTGLLFALFFSYCLYDTMQTWISRANYGHPFR